MTRLHAFFSVKGGAGKTAVSLLSALAFAREGRPVAVLDADLTGTSLGDGLALEAPDLLVEGQMRWAGARVGWLSRSATLSRRRERSVGATSVQLPYLDLLLQRALNEPFDPDALAWRHPDVGGVRWYPSSPVPTDASLAARSVFRDRSFGRRLVHVVQRIAESLGPDGVVLVDLPPGMFGVGTWVAGLDGVVDELRPVLVTTDDRNDLYRAVEEYIGLKQAFPRTVWVLNRSVRTPEQVRDDVRNYLGTQWPGVERDLKNLGRQPQLERLFVDDGLSVTTELTQRTLQLLE